MGEGGGGEGGGGVESSDGRGGGDRAAACQSVCGGGAPGHLGILECLLSINVTFSLSRGGLSHMTQSGQGFCGRAT